MFRRFATLLLLPLLAIGLALWPAAVAQEEEEASRLQRFLEQALSSPERTVRIGEISGVLSPDVRFARITIADPEGVWLVLDDLTVSWNRLSLLRGRIDIEALTAERIEFLRRPQGSEEPSAEPGGGFGLPLDLEIGAFEVPVIDIGEPVAGTAATLSASGALSVTGDGVRARLATQRLDAPGGTLSLSFVFQPAEEVLEAEASLSEPAGGLLASLLSLPGRPALDLRLEGSGPLGDWAAELAFAADGEEVVAGTAAIQREAEGYRATAELGGTLARVVPPDYRALLAGQSRLALAATRHDDGRLLLNRMELLGERIEARADAVLAADGFPEAGRLDLALGPMPDAPVTLPFLPGRPAVAAAALEAELGGPAGQWRARLAVSELIHDLGGAERASLEASGTAEGLAAPAERAIRFTLAGQVRGAEPADPGLAPLFAQLVTLEADGAWRAGAPILFERLVARSGDLEAEFAGAASAERLEGRWRLGSPDIAPLSALVSRPLGGHLALGATGWVAPPGGTFAFNLDGRATDLSLGIPALDPLLSGEVALSGGIARGPEGLRLDDLGLSGDAVRARLSGELSDPSISLSFESEIPDLRAVTDRASGAVRLTGRLAGPLDAPELDLELGGERIVLMGQELREASGRFSGVVAGPEAQGAAALSARLDGVPVEASFRLAAHPDLGQILEDVRFLAGPNRIDGRLVLLPDGLVEGDLALVAPDLAVVGPLLLARASGALSLEMSLSTVAGRQSAEIAGAAENVRFEDIAIGFAAIQATALDLFVAPIIEGELSATQIRAAGLLIRSATGTARREAERTAFDLVADLADGEAALRGALEPAPGGFDIALDALRFSRAGQSLRLAEPSRVRIRDGAALLDNLVLLADGGRARIDGRAGESLDLTVSLSAIPASVANAFAPELGAEGALSGSARVQGTAAQPRAAFEAEWQAASARPLREAGLPAFDVAAQGTYADALVRIEAQARSAAGLDLRIAGTIGTEAPGALDLSVAGEVPLALAARQLEGRETRLTGTLDLDVAVGGTMAAPSFAGRLTSRGAGLVDPETGIVLRDIALDARLTDEALAIETLTAASGETGTVSASGSVGIDATAGFPLDLTVTVRNGRYVDGRLVAATLDADLTVTGSLAGQPQIGGTVRIERAEIAVPERLPRDHVAVHVDHVAAAPPVEATIRRAQPRPRPDRTGAEAGLLLDVVIEAPARIFVRGRGLDAELGGRLALVGPISDVSAVGAFEMRRGRLDVLTQRITFDRGTLDFAGDLDPILDFSGTTRSGAMTINVTVTGRASDPAIRFSSVPELPEDEVLAQLLFGRSLSDLSPLQLARLAAAAAELGGLGEGPGLLQSLRRAAGLDELDVVADEDGGLAVRAGRYINERIYFGLQQGATAQSSRATIELDISPDLKGRGELRGDGRSSLGIFFEREY